jgi:hypothetical protein
MAEPIYGVHMLRRRAEWYSLSKEEQDEFLSRVSKMPAQAGVNIEAGLNICRALADEWEFFGVYEYPDLATRERLANMYEEAQVGRYLESTLLLGKHPARGVMGMFKED